MAWSLHIRKVTPLWISVSSKYHQIGTIFNATIILRPYLQYHKHTSKANWLFYPIANSIRRGEFTLESCYTLMLLHAELLQHMVPSPNCQVLSVRVRMADYRLSSDVCMYYVYDFCAWFLCIRQIHLPVGISVLTFVPQQLLNNMKTSFRSIHHERNSS